MPEYERDGHSSSDATPLLETFSRQSALGPSLLPSSLSLSLPLSLPSPSGTLKQMALLCLAVCVVGYLCIVALEMTPLVSPTAALSRFSLSSASSDSDCHVHTHESVDDPFTVDERIDHLLYRTLKVAIDSGDDERAAAVAKELAHSAHERAALSPSQDAAARKVGKADKEKRRKWPPTTEEVEAVKALVEKELAAEVKARTEEQWALKYSGERRSLGYIHRPKYHLGGSWRLSADGCINLDGQCSAPSKDAAAALCARLPQCRGFACNKERTDCQLRVAPLVHDSSRPSFDSYYKTATDLATADQRTAVKRRLELTLMAPGAVAAADFDWKAQCSPTFKCVVAYGLYGDSPKYVEGALDNVRLVPTVFPGWVARIYHDKSVPRHSLERLQSEGAELVMVDTDAGDKGMRGNIAGMFWRFLVAEDASVQRYIVRDSDSRLNPREAAAVQEWVDSGFSVHTIRDHPNHDRQLNGGLWGGVRGAVPNIRQLILETSLNGYGADLSFLGDKVWPLVQYDQLGHDAYTCEKYINSVGFPTQRPDDYQHVGQVFEWGKPREYDITGFMTGVEVPLACRRNPEWKYG